MDKCSTVFNYFTQCIRRCFSSMSYKEIETINEITLISGQPLLVQLNGCRQYAGYDGLTADPGCACVITQKDISIIYEAITNSSEYAYSRFINEGFITLPFGHRVGITGNCVVRDDKIININHINALSFRLAHSCSNNANLIIDDIIKGQDVLNTLIISPPGCGKTTLIRGLAELISGSLYGVVRKCAIVDERYELASCHNGIASLNVGNSSLIISGCKKSVAIPLVVRSMSPDIIFTDEVSGLDDFEAIKYAKASGCKIIASVHGSDEKNNELSSQNFASVFDRIVILNLTSGPGTIAKVL